MVVFFLEDDARHIIIVILYHDGSDCTLSIFIVREEGLFEVLAMNTQFLFEG
jgi:hypothetical protein